MKTVIISGGYIEDAFALEWLEQNRYDLLIAADSGMNFLYRNHLKPDIIAGDFDSVNREAYDFFVGAGVESSPEIIRLNPMKDDTDTEFAIRTAINRGAGQITILGGTGTRLDHVLGNIELLGIGLSSDVAIELVDAHNRIRMIKHPISLDKKTQFGKYVSLIPFTKEVTGVTLEGFKYPLVEHTLERFNTLGISNEIVEEEAKIGFCEGILIVVEARD